MDRTQRISWSGVSGVIAYLLWSMLVAGSPSVAGDGNVGGGLGLIVSAGCFVISVIVAGITYYRLTKNAVLGAAFVGVFTFIVQILIVWGVTALASLFVEYWWFTAKGQAEVFLKPLYWKVGLWVLGSLLTLVALMGIREAFPYPKRPTVLDDDPSSPFHAGDPARIGSWIAMVAGVVMGGAGLSGLWDEILPYLNRVQWGNPDPVFGLDPSFYIYELPVYQGVLSWSFMLLVMAVLYEFIRVSYWLLTKKFSSIQLRVIKTAGVLGILFVLFNAAGAYLAPFSLMFETHEHYTGPGYTDVIARIPLMQLMPFVTLGAMSLAVFAFMRDKFGLLVFAVVTPFVASFLIGRDGYLWVWIVWIVMTAIILGVIDVALGKRRPSIGRIAATAGSAFLICHLFGWPAIVQSFQVAPEELPKEREYIARHLTATKQAYGIDTVQSQDFPYTPTLSGDDYRANEVALSQVRAQDWNAVLTFANDQKELQTYYDFQDVDPIFTPSGLHMSAVREINPGAIANRAWSNVHLQYTCGQGWVVASSNKFARDGSPQFLVDFIPMNGDASLIPQRPGVCFGEIANNWVITNSRLPEQGNPSGEPGQDRYTGNGGVLLGSGIKRLAFALAMDDYRILTSGQLTAESQVLFHRRVLDQLNLVAPFIAWDNDPFAVNGGEQLVWMADGASTAKNYPYALWRGEFNAVERDSFNYMRPSVKATIGAYHGDMRVYAFNPSEPVLATWMRVYPTLFTSVEQMPESLRAQVRYPEDPFIHQMDVFQRYHVDTPDSLYNTDNVWLVASERYGRENVTIQPRYLNVRLPGGEGLESVLALPFNQSSKENGQLVARSVLRAYVVVRIGAQYGEFTSLEMPQNVTVVGSEQIQGNINTYLTTTGQTTFTESNNATLQWGNLIMVPVTSRDGQSATMVYIKPQFSQRDPQSPLIYLVKTYIVGSDGRMVDGFDLQSALPRFMRGEGLVTDGQGTDTGESSPGEGTTLPPSAAEDVTAVPATGDCGQLVSQLEAAIARQRAGDSSAAEEIARIGLEIGLTCGATR